MTGPPNRGREQLAERLRLLRAAQFRSGSQFAAHIGWPQPRVSKLETGAQLPTDDDIDAWVRATDADDEVSTELHQLLSSLRIEYVNNRDAARRRGGLAVVQSDIADAEAQASRIATFQPAMVPGLIQTSAYARDMLMRPDRPTCAGSSEEDLEQLIAQRVRRQDILYQPNRQVQVIVGEAALRSAPGSVGTLLAQLDRMLSFAELPAVELGVVGFPVMPVAPLSGFVLYDDKVAIVESLSGEQEVFDPDEVQVYTQAFEQLRAAAVYGADAVALIREVSTQLRR